jgi:hypothetical protein
MGRGCARGGGGGAGGVREQQRTAENSKSASFFYEISLRLPEEAAREALEFIVFLEGRYAATPADAAMPALDEAARQEALKRLDQIRIAWGGKPIGDRDALYDDGRG